MTTNDLTIEMETFRQWLEQGRLVTVLDVRPAEERAEWMIPGSIHVDAYHALKAGDPQPLAGVMLPDDAPVVTICGAGKVSLIAARSSMRAAYGHTRSKAGCRRGAWPGTRRMCPCPAAPRGLFRFVALGRAVSRI